MYVAPAWIEAHCVVPDGFKAGRPFELYDYQALYLLNFYTVRGDVVFDEHSPILAPAFVHRRGLLIGPQKVGKNPLIATQVCLEGVGPALFGGWSGADDGYVCRDRGCGCGWEYPYELGEPMGMPWATPLIQITAFSEKSTENTYDALRPMIELGPLAALIPKTGEEFIRLPGGGRIDTVTSSNQSRLGGRSTFVPQDELGLWTPQTKMTKLADTQYRNLAGMGGRASLTSNAWDPAEQSVAQREYESKAADVYRQFVRPPESLSFANKVERRKIFHIVYPPDTLRENGGHVDLDSIEAEAADMAQRDMAQAARFFGNKLVAGAGVAVDPERWKALLHVPRYEIIAIGGDLIRGPSRGTYIGCGFDGSIYKDETWLVGCTVDGYGFRIGSWRRPQGADMERWKKENPGKEWSVPRAEVHERIAWTRTYYRVGRFFPDPPRWWTEIEGWEKDFGLATDDKPVVLVFDTNQAKRFAPAVDRWLTAIAEGTHTNDGDPELAAQIEAAHLKKVKLADQDDDQTMYLLVKGSDKKPIDGAIADVLAHAAAQTMPAEPPPSRSRYDTQGIDFI